MLACDVTLQDGETIGFSADDKHTITRSPGVSLPEEQMTLKIGYEPIKGDPEDDSCDHSDNDDKQDEEEFSNPEVYTEEEMEAVEEHIEQYFGKFENVFHELVSPDIHVDICVVPPSEERLSLIHIFIHIFRQTVEYLEFTHSDGVEMDFHFAIAVVTDLAAILLECSVSGSVNLQDLDEYNTSSRRIRITATPEEHLSLIHI